ncbi:MAG TPA: hypothetical protein VGM76_13700, partial [Lacipirellulaceae bacterium]
NLSVMNFGGSVDYATLNGDFNHDGTVDAADYTVWRDSLGSTFNLAADGNGNGMIDAGDYGVWTGHFGTVLPGAGAEVGARSEERGASAEEIAVGSQLSAVGQSDGVVAGPQAKGAAVVFASPRAESLFAIPHAERAGNSNVADTLRVSKSALGVPPSVRDDALLVWLAEQPMGGPALQDSSRHDLPHEASAAEMNDDVPAAVDDVFAGLVVALA